jgi:perosamine synthetase
MPSLLPPIPIAAPVLGGNEMKYVQECLETTWISSIGRFIPAFEESFAKFCGVKHAIAVNNGTTALHLALVALGVGPGDEVIVPTLTYIATANAVRYCDATPILVDCDPRTLNIDPAAIAARITPRTKGIVVVHLYGHPVDLDPVLELARARGLFLLEDAAEAHGAEYKGRRVGGFGDCATFSFFGNKIITTGEGGMVTTNDDALAARLRLHRGQGMEPGRRYWHPVIGYNYRMTNIAAAIGLAQMERVDEALQTRWRIAGWYRAHLAPLASKLTMLPEESWARAVYWLVTVLLTHGGEAERDAVMLRLDADGIETRPVFYPMHIQPPHRDDAHAYPCATSGAARGINLPTHARLTEDDVKRICASLDRAIR